MSKRPDIVFITLDAWRYDALGLAPDKHWLERYGLVSKLRTPNLDRFAAEGVYFTQALSTAPHTTSSHASIMTGLFPPQHGVRSFFCERLPDEVETLAEVLRSHGYATFTLRETEDSSKPGILQEVDVLREFGTVVHDLKQLAKVSQQAVADDRPVFAFLHLWDLHAPYLYSSWARQAGVLGPLGRKVQSLAEQWQVEPPDPGDVVEQQEMMDFQRKVADRIQDVDLRIKTLFEWYVEGITWFDQRRWPVVESALKESGLWDNTVIFVFGDHGEGVHPDGHGVNVFNHGRSLLDDQLRVPLLVRGLPDTASKRIDQQVSLVDLAPTALDMLGIAWSETSVNGQASPKGRSLLPLLGSPFHTGPAPLHFAELCRGGPDFTLARPSRQYLYQSCARGGRYKLICHHAPVLMKRYLSWQDRFGRLGRRLGRTFFKTQEAHLPDNGTDCGKLYWTDLQADPDEIQPRRWNGRIPAAVVYLRTEIEELYQSVIRGPVIDADGADESALRRR